MLCVVLVGPLCSVGRARGYLGLVFTAGGWGFLWVGVTPAATVDSDASRLLLLLLLLLLLPPHLQVAAAAGFCLRGEAVLRTLQRRCCGRVACR